MKTLNLFVSLVLVLFLTGCSNKQVVEADYAIIPLPQDVTAGEGEFFELNKNTVIIYQKDNIAQERIANFLAGYIKESAGLELSVSTAEKISNAIILKSDYDYETPESYHLDVNKDRIVINGSDDPGTFHGVQTLRKSIPTESKGHKVLFPPVDINDYPRFGYRGMHMDVSRHFFPVEVVKEYIDILALHNVNILHWHLTDDQGWRIEIKKHPKLTEIGSQRAQTVIGKNTGAYDGIPHGGYYTQEEIKDIVKYAEERFITIIPEVDLPGHMLAALATYPELGCTGGPYKVCEIWGVLEDVLCAGNEDVYTFLEDVFTEVVELFPSEYIHVGGDECPKIRWEECLKCQAKIKELGLKSDKNHTAEERLQSYVIQRMEKFLNSKGRRVIGWDEILEGGIAPNATIMSWRGFEGGIEAARQGHDVIMVPTSYCYFDYYQMNNIDNEPMGIGGYVPIEKVYSLEPVPEELKEDERKHIIGTQANIWAEYVLDKEYLQYKLLPRLAALSEVQWTMPEKKDYEGFLFRLENLMKHYDEYGYNYSTAVFDIEPEVTADTLFKTINVKLKAFGNPPIYYTLDGTEPTESSFRYDSVIEINSTVKIRAHVISSDNVKRKGYEESFGFNKATFKKVTLINPTMPRYTYNGASTLTNGIRGGRRFNSGEWLGFIRKDFEAIVDLENETTISEVSIGTYIDIFSWISGIREYTVLVSDDNQNFKQVFHQEYPPFPEGQQVEIREIIAKFTPENTRYVKIIAKTDKLLPEWSYGKGNPPCIFIDEIAVN